MKGILGRKVGMTSVFTDAGINIPVTVIEVQPNVVTNVLTEENSGYKGIQLSAFDRRDKTESKPVLGHLKKANTSAKYFTKEIRNMEGFELGSKIDASIFQPGELVDITGTSKGKGFQGSIKRHNQAIGPKSHGGAGGSKDHRLTGSIGDVSSNRVFKGMTMPGQMGNVQRTMQNLEIVSIDLTNNIVLVKGSIPGPNKSFVVIKEAVKGLPSKEVVKLVDIAEASQKNELLEQAKKAGADINTDMTVEEMKTAIAAAAEAKKAEGEAKKAEETAKKAEEVKEKVEKAAEKAKDDAEKAEQSGDAEAAKELKEKADSLEKQAEKAEETAKKAEATAKEAEAEATQKEKEAEKLQVEEEVVEEEVKTTETPKEDKKEEGDK